MKRSRWLKVAALGLAILLAGLVGCKGPTEVGSEELLDIDEREQERRLGEIINSPDSDQSQQQLGASPSPTDTSPPPEQKVYFDLSLINDNPYYEPSNQIQLAAGTIIRITNKDDNARRFSTPEGPYDSGDIAVGGTVEVVLNIKGDFRVEDPNVPFAIATLQVF